MMIVMMIVMVKDYDDYHGDDKKDVSVVVDAGGDRKKVVIESVSLPWH